MKIIEVNMDDGEECLVFPTATSSRFPRTCGQPPIILGDFFAATVDLGGPEQAAFLLVNWRTQEYVAFTFRVLPSSSHLVWTEVRLSANSFDAANIYLRRCSTWSCSQDTSL